MKFKIIIHIYSTDNILTCRHYNSTGYIRTLYRNDTHPIIENITRDIDFDYIDCHDDDYRSTIVGLLK